MKIFLYKSMLLMCLMCASTVLCHKKFIKKFSRRYYPTKTKKKISSSQFTRILSQNVKLSCFCHLKIRLIWSVVESLVLFFCVTVISARSFPAWKQGLKKIKLIRSMCKERLLEPKVRHYRAPLF